MSSENYAPAWRTKLGNLTAKSVLVHLADEADATDGVAFSRLERIAELTEVKKRTVLRILSVFEAIGLLQRTEAMLHGKMRPALQLNLAMLGGDLRAEFAAAYQGAMGKEAPPARNDRQRDAGAAGCRSDTGKCRSDTPKSVAATRESVAATRESVAATQPPNPHKGVPRCVPVCPTPPTPPLPREGEKERELARATEQVVSALGLRKRKRRLIAEQLALEAEKGEVPATAALAMIAAFRRQAEMSHLLLPCGVDKFFGDGIWRDERRWFWDKQALRDRDRAMH